MPEDVPATAVPWPPPAHALPLAPARPAVALFAGAVRPLASWGHDWVLDTGVRQFAAKAVHTTVTRR